MSVVAIFEPFQKAAKNRPVRNKKRLKIPE
jgi:hypothetical protein